jgi:cytochrome c oxidase subunit 1/cytochrome c oxidase subunit I+III
MFAVGLGHSWDLAFGASSMLIAVPTGVKILNWTATMLGGVIRFTTSMCFAIAFLITFTIGGLTFRSNWHVSTFNHNPTWRLWP